jgi:hypothetical protein
MARRGNRDRTVGHRMAGIVDAIAIVAKAVEELAGRENIVGGHRLPGRDDFKAGSTLHFVMQQDLATVQLGF